MLLQNWNGGEIHKNNARKYIYVKDGKTSCLYDNVSDLVAGQIPEVTYGLSKTRLKPIARKSAKKTPKITVKNLTPKDTDIIRKNLKES